MRICITRSSRNAYSETFIKDQIAGFSELATVYPIHSGRFPEREENGALLNPPIFWAINKVVKSFLGRNNFFADYGVKRYLKQHKVDVVLSNYGMSAAHMVAPCKALGIPLIVIFHGHDATDTKILKTYKGLYQKLFAYASAIVAVSGEMKQRLIGMGADAHKIHVVPCGVNTHLFKPNRESSKSKRLLAVGRFTPKKGPLVTIRAFQKVHEHHPDATLTMVGKPDGLYEQCKALVGELGLDGAVKFPGIMGHDDISKLMTEATLFVQHSVTAPNGDKEGTPVSIMEACASGLPVVSTLHGGIMEAVVDGQTGFLVEENAVEDYAARIIQLLNNPEMCQQFGAAGRQHMEAHYEQKGQILKLYELAKVAL